MSDPCRPGVIPVARSAQDAFECDPCRGYFADFFARMNPWRDQPVIPAAFGGQASPPFTPHRPEGDPVTLDLTHLRPGMIAAVTLDGELLRAMALTPAANRADLA